MREIETRKILSCAVLGAIIGVLIEPLSGLLADLFVFFAWLALFWLSSDVLKKSDFINKKYKEVRKVVDDVQ